MLIEMIFQLEIKEKELVEANNQIDQMKDTLSKVLSAQPGETFNTASTINLEDDQGYFGSYSSVDIHYEMLKVNDSDFILVPISTILVQKKKIVIIK